MEEVRWSRSKFAKWAQENALKPQLPQERLQAFQALPNFDLWACPDYIYGTDYQKPLPDGWCDYCQGGRLPKDYRKWGIKVWVPVKCPTTTP